ncbi:hypothetical protein ES708_34804 [subsurface metagenome]
MREVDENPTPAQDPSSTPNHDAYPKRVATCPITAEAPHGRGSKIFKLMGNSSNP